MPQIPPTQVSGFNTSSTSINVTWVAIPSAQVKGVLTSYTVQYLPLDKYGNNVTDRQQFTVPSTQMSAELKGLKKYTNYSISVSGVTRDIGVESQSIFVRTSEDGRSNNNYFTNKSSSFALAEIPLTTALLAVLSAITASRS